MDHSWCPIHEAHVEASTFPVLGENYHLSGKSRGTRSDKQEEPNRVNEGRDQLLPSGGTNACPVYLFVSRPGSWAGILMEPEVTRGRRAPIGPKRPRPHPSIVRSGEPLCPISLHLLLEFLNIFSVVDSVGTLVWPSTVAVELCVCLVRVRVRCVCVCVSHVVQDVVACAYGAPSPHVLGRSSPSTEQAQAR
ncbi:hypothetical protein J6590_029204 [Homalodisca vitripennis]|nr:hypothetical protein J6590_029204 [Homalodisca vitripennis]